MKEIRNSKRGKRPKIVLIGRRNGAIAAARRLGFRAIVIDVQARREQSAAAFGGTVAWAIEQAIKACGDSPPVAAIAVATGSVMAAAAIREHFNLPGISSATALRCHDKLVMKKAIAHAEIPCAPWLETNDATTPDEVITALGLPLVLKLPISSGGRGVWICQNRSEVAQHLRPDLLAEGFVQGIEMSVESLRVDGETVFRNHSSYLIPRIANVIPARLTDLELTAIQTLTERVHEALDIESGITHLEIFLSKNGPIFSEIAARPPGGYLMELMHRAYKFDPWEVLIRLALNEKIALPIQAIQHAGVWLLHPGKGKVSAVTGLLEAQSTPGISEVVCHLKEGDSINTRIGSGESVGRILASGHDYESCAHSLRQAAEAIRIHLTED